MNDPPGPPSTLVEAHVMQETRPPSAPDEEQGGIRPEEFPFADVEFPQTCWGLPRIVMVDAPGEFDEVYEEFVTGERLAQVSWSLS